MRNRLRTLFSGNIPTAAFFLASTAVLFFAFSHNTWHVAEQEFFENHQIGMQSFIVGRILKTEADGIFSAGGLTGLTGPDPTPPDTEHPNYRFQYQAYRESLPFQSYGVYKSQIGGQGMLLGALDGLLPWPPQDKLTFLQGLTSLLSAFALSLVFLWFAREIGLTAAAAALIGTVGSQWLTVFGRNLWWSIWAFYLPLVVMLCFFRRLKGRPDIPWGKFGIVFFLAVLVKCFFNGYEYITTTLIMTAVPLVYHSVRYRIGWKNFLLGSLTAISASAGAILVSMTVLCLQIASVEGSFAKGIEHILFSLQARSYGDPSLFPPDYAASLNANVLEVLGYYLREIYIDFNNYFQAPNDLVANFVMQFRYLYLIVLFAAASLALLGLLRSARAAGFRPAGQGMIAALWFSILAPLSWLILFKAHSYIHTFMNDLIWQMPFTIFGFAVFGLALRTSWAALRGRSA